jgi:glycine cleavage system H protein
VGITDYMQQKLTDIVYFDPPEVGTAVDQFGEAGTLESTKAVFEIVSPVTGVVTAFNLAVDRAPDLVNQDPYDAGWLVELELTAWGEDRALLADGAAYAKDVARKAVDDADH